MTNPQKFDLYLPAWNAARKANWRTERGSVLAVEGRTESEWLTNVEDIAGRLAHREARGPKIDDYRHAVNYVATADLQLRAGKPVRGKLSSKELTEPELDHVMTLLALLLNPLDLEAVRLWQFPEEKQRPRLIWGIHNTGLSASRLRDLSYHFNRDHGSDWATLPIDKLKAFSRYCWANKPGRRRRPVPA